jgi:hypothetical protein
MNKGEIMKITFFCLITALLLVGGCARELETAETSPEPQVSVLGYGRGQFEIGELLYASNFGDSYRWDVQIQPKEGFAPAMTQFVDNQLSVFVPGRGCTVWLKQKIKGPVTIVYNVVCPSASTSVEGVQARDINNFWMANDPVIDGGLFDEDRYSGAFFDYHKMNAYYASTGGGGAQGNQTTRFRIYPRIVDGDHVRHLSLNYRDRQREFLITPDKVHTVQLVAFNDIVQYIVDGKVVYQIKNGDTVEVEKQLEDGIEVEKAIYDTRSENFPLYTEGYFGFRMVATHHIYSNFRVYKLNPL